MVERGHVRMLKNEDYPCLMALWTLAYDVFAEDTETIGAFYLVGRVRGIWVALGTDAR